MKPHPSIIEDLHISGVVMKVYPFLRTLSIAQLVRANSKIAASFLRNTNFEVVILAPLSKSNKSYFLPIAR